jgi:hypothetical protein
MDNAGLGKETLDWKLAEPLDCALVEKLDTGRERHRRDQRAAILQFFETRLRRTFFALRTGNDFPIRESTTEDAPFATEAIARGGIACSTRRLVQLRRIPGESYQSPCFSCFAGKPSTHPKMLKTRFLFVKVQSASAAHRTVIPQVGLLRDHLPTLGRTRTRD